MVSQQKRCITQETNCITQETNVLWSQRHSLTNSVTTVLSVGKSTLDRRVLIRSFTVMHIHYCTIT